MEENALHIVIVGHVDHGKSTLVGRLFYDTGSLPPDKLEEIRRASESLGKELEFAYVMDNLEEEREKGITIDIAHTFFKTAKRRYVIIDAPGHKEFLKNMISGTSQADAALLIVDISQGIREQTLRHCYILGMLGIKQTAVIVNKMDLSGYSAQGFMKIREEITAVLAKHGIRPDFVIPISARLGENVAKRVDALSWYDGPTVLEALDSFSNSGPRDAAFRFPVQDVYDFIEPGLSVGRVESGEMKVGQELYVLPDMKKVKIKAIKKGFMGSGHESIERAGVAECVGVLAEGASLKRGDILADTLTSTITDSVRANIFWMVDKEYTAGIPLTFRCATQEARGRIEKIYRRFDPASDEIVNEGSSVIRPAEVAEVEIRLEGRVAVEKFTEIPELGRFVLEHAGHPVAGGIIV